MRRAKACSLREVKTMLLSLEIEHAALLEHEGGMCLHCICSCCLQILTGYFLLHRHPPTEA